MIMAAPLKITLVIQEDATDPTTAHVASAELPSDTWIEIAMSPVSDIAERYLEPLWLTALQAQSARQRSKA